MTAPQQGPSGGLGDSMGNFANRGVILVLIAVVIGFILLAQGFGDRGSDVTAATDGGDSSTDTTTTAAPTTSDASGTTVAGGAGTGTGAGTTGTGGSAPETTVAETLHAPEEVVVLATNGSGESGIASALRDKLTAQGYVADAANALPTEASQILFRPGYGLDATQIANLLGVETTVVVQIGADDPAPVQDDAIERAAASNVIVIAGADGVIR